MESALDRQAVARRGKQLEYFTITWNSLEGLVAVVAGALAGSISLVGFGVDSNKLAKLLTDKLPSGLPTLFNPWRDPCADCEPCNGPDAKRARLAAHGFSIASRLALRSQPLHYSLLTLVFVAR
jgi:hypothetical protein